MRESIVWSVVVLVLACLAVVPANGQIRLLEENELMQAARQNDTAAIRSLMIRGVSPNRQDSEGRTPLILAAINDNLAMARELLAHGATPNQTDRLGNTALHWAAEGGNPDLVGTLVAARAQPNRQNREGLTPLMMAARRDHVPVIEALIDAGADLGTLDYTGRSALGWAQEARAGAAAAWLRQAGAE